MSDIAEAMKANALEAQRFSRKHLVLELDFSEASIDLIEANANDVEYAIKGGKSEENVAMLVRIWGAYIGESLRKVCGGEWADVDGQTCLRNENAATSPQDHVRKRIVEGGAAHLGDYFRRMKQELQSL
ncbi:MAG: hypothetical protein H8E66_25520 [Planctomycetes bacterium]|nr:hypothetical protein [Planctomycetota bacterium]